MSISINHHREGAGPPLVLLHGVGHHWQAWRPVIERLAGEFDVIACDSPGFGALGAAARRDRADGPRLRRRVRVVLRRARPRTARTSRATRWAARSRSSSRAGAPCSSASAFSPAGFWTAAELRFCQLSLRPLAGLPVRGAPAGRSARAHARRARRAVQQNFGYPARLPAEEAVATLQRRVGLRPRSPPR